MRGQVLHKMFPLVDRPFAKIYISFTESKSKINFFHMFSFHSPSREHIGIFAQKTYVNIGLFLLKVM